MALLYNLARETTATVGTGTLTLGGATSGFLTFALAGVTNGQQVEYSINDTGTPGSEKGIGTYTAIGNTLSRDTVYSSTNGGAKISLSGTAQVFIDPSAQYLAASVGTGTVTTVSVVTANGVSGSVANPTTTPAITIALGAITPTTVNGNTLTTGTGTLTLGSVTLNAGAGGTLGSNAFTSTGYLPLAGGTLTGNLIFSLDNTLDIGASGATRPRTGYFGTSLVSPLFNGLAITNNGTNTLAIAAGKTLTANASVTLAGTDGKTLTLSNSGTLAGGDAFVLAIAAGKTLTVSNTLTFTGTDSSSVAFGTGGTVLYANQSITLSGDVTGTGTTAITTVVAKIAGTTVSGTTGTTNVVFSASPTLSGIPVLGAPTATSLALGGATIGANALAVTGTSLFNSGVTVSSASLTLSGNQSAAAWTTSGIRYMNVAGTLTDTTSSGTVAAAYTNVYGGSTIAASNSTTFTNYYNTYIKAPVAGTNVVFTNGWSLGVDSAFIAGAFAVGVNGGTGGSAVFAGSTSGTATVRVAAAAGTATIFQLPATNGSNTNVLQTDGTGVTSWVAVGSGVSGGNLYQYTVSV